MTRCRALLAIEAVALLGILVWALARPVTEARGRDEIDYRNLQPIRLSSGQLLRQPVPLQHDNLTGVAIPYQLQGGQPAELRVLVLDAGDRRLVDARWRVSPSKALDFVTVRIDARPSNGQIVLLVERWDQGTGDLNLFAFPAATTGRPGMLQQPDTTLALQTLYGAWRPAILKAPVYAARVASLAPPWLPEPLDLVLVGLFLVLGLAVVVLIAVDRVEPEPSPIMTREFAPADATSSRDRDPRLP